MRRLLLLILVCLLPSLTWGGTEVIIVGQGAAASSCATTHISETDASAGSLTNFPSRVYMGTKWVATDNVNVCSITLYLQRNGSPTMNIRACLYSALADPDEPDAAIACSDYIAASTVGASEEAVVFSITPSAVTNTTVYYTVLQSSAAGDVSNNIVWHYETSGTTERMVSDDDGVTTWTFLNNAMTMKHVITVE